MERILICDDSEYLRLTIRKIVEQLGHEVIAEASNGEEAIEKYIQVKPSLITLDVVMPKMNGMEALKKIMDIDQDVKVLLVTAIGHDLLIKKALQMGASGYVIKPFNTEQFISNFNSIV